MTRRDDNDESTAADGSPPTDDAADTDASDAREPRRGRPPDAAAPDADGRTDPRRIASLAVTESDVVDALEATARGGRGIVLRVTPPFSGRMRARIHDAGAVDADGDADTAAAEAPGPEGGDAAAPVHIPPERFVADPPPYPSVDDTEDELRASETPYTRERHRKRHQAAVEEWRSTVRDRLVGKVTLHTDAGPTTVSVSYLG